MAEDAPVRLDRMLIEARQAFQAAGIAEAALDARVLLAGLLDLAPGKLISDGDRPVPEADQTRIRAAIRQRCAGMPVYRILGHREFHGHSFRLSAETLEPRPDTETLVDAAIEAAREMVSAGGRCLLADLGIGTGAIGLSVLAAVPSARCVGVDISPDAVATAKANADGLGLSDRYEARTGNWFDGIEEVFDLVLSNPPYIPSADIEELAPEVRLHDPVQALDGGSDGLEAYREIASGAGPRLAPGGVVMVEIGIGQGADVAAIFQAEGFDLTGARADLAGIERVLIFKRP